MLTLLIMVIGARISRIEEGSCFHFLVEFQINFSQFCLVKAKQNFFFRLNEEDDFIPRRY